MERIDFANNMASLIHGHADPDIVAAVGEQMKRGSAFTVATEIEIEFAEHLCGRCESLEQLRALWHGHRITVVECPSGSPAVDTPEDVRRIEEILARRSEEPRPTDLDR